MGSVWDAPAVVRGGRVPVRAAWGVSCAEGGREGEGERGTFEEDEVVRVGGADEEDAPWVGDLEFGGHGWWGGGVVLGGSCGGGWCRVGRVEVGVGCAGVRSGYARCRELRSRGRGL